MVKRLSNWFDNFIEQRLAVANSITTTHRRTYILPNRFGYLLLLIVFLMMIAAINYQNSLVFVLTFSLMAIGLNTLVLTYRNLINLKVRVLPTKPIYASQELHVPIKVIAESGRDHYSVGIGDRIGVQELLDIADGSTHDATVLFHPEERGWYQPGRFYLVTSYPFGILRVWSWFRCKQRYLVYPKPIAPPFDLSLLGKAVEQDSNDLVEGQDDFYSIKEYEPGDPKRNIHWRAYAKGQGLYSKHFSEPKGQIASFDYHMFDQFDTYNRVELRLSWLCYLILDAAENQVPFSMTLPGQSFPVDMSKGHVEQCLEALAVFGHNPDTGSER